MIALHSHRAIEREHGKAAVPCQLPGRQAAPGLFRRARRATTMGVDEAAGARQELAW